MGLNSVTIAKSLARDAFASEPLPANDNFFLVLFSGVDPPSPFRLRRTSRPSIVTDPALRQSQKIYDAAGNVLQEIHGLGTPNQMTYATYTYATGTGFGANGGDGEKLSVYDADGSTHTTNYVYDGFNRLIQTLYPDNTPGTFSDADLNGKVVSGSFVSGYDYNGNVLTRTNRAGQVFTYSFDPLNRMLTEVDPAYGSTGANTITTSYDLGGRVTGVVRHVRQWPDAGLRHGRPPDAGCEHHPRALGHAHHEIQARRQQQPHAAHLA